jgi:hypothetical protein
VYSVPTPHFPVEDVFGTYADMKVSTSWVWSFSKGLCFYFNIKKRRSLVMLLALAPN